MRINNLEEYKLEKENFDKNPEEFWAKKANSFTWHKKWEEILDWDFHKAHVKWFDGGKLNEIVPMKVAPKDFIVGKENFTVIDPGPAIEEHIKDIVKVCGEDISQILVTHTHPDHSPGAKLLHQRTAAPVMGMYAKYPKHQDRTFKPNKELSEGDEIKEVDHTLIAIHTPGHASNHICFFLEEEKMLFTGDHIMEGSTVVISPPDGNMREYIDSLEKLKALGIETIAPGHGETMRDANAVVDWIVSHRMFREKKVVDAITELNRCTIDELLPKVYDDVGSHLHGIAKSSLEAHLIKLIEEEKVTKDKDIYIWG